MQVTLPNSSGDRDSTISVPIVVGDLTGLNVIAYQTTIAFDENVLDATGASSVGTLSAAFGSPIIDISLDGQVSLGGFGTAALSDSGTIVNMTFNVVGESGSSTDITFSSFVFNAGTPAANTMGGTFTVDSAVPVELTTFSAVVLDELVELRWSTATETNNYGFEVQESRDREKFFRLGFVPGHGTIVVPQQYVFLDKDVEPGKSFYRLKQIDLGGTFEFSGIVEVEVPIPRELTLSQNYPNPFNLDTIIEFRLDTPQRVIVEILNVQGELIRILLNEDLSLGSHHVRWNGLNNESVSVASGLYLYRVNAGGSAVTNKMVLLK